MTYQEFVDKYLNREFLTRVIQYMRINPQQIDMTHGLVKDKSCGTVECIAGTVCLLGFDTARLKEFQEAEAALYYLPTRYSVQGFFWDKIEDIAFTFLIKHYDSDADEIWDHANRLQDSLHYLFMIHEYEGKRFYDADGIVLLPGTSAYVEKVISIIEEFSKTGELLPRYATR